MFTVYTFGDSILDCAGYNEERVDPAGLILANRDDLFPEFHGRDLWTRFDGLARVERWARDGSRVGDLPTEDVGQFKPGGPSVALLTIGGNDLLGGLVHDDGPGIVAFVRELTSFLDALPIRPVLLGNVYDPTFGDDHAFDDVFKFDPPKARANFNRLNATLAEIAPRYGALVDLQRHFRTGRPDWFIYTIEPSLRGASEVRRCFLDAIEAASQ
jgi:acyl-CoA thioesterase I